MSTDPCGYCNQTEDNSQNECYSPALMFTVPGVCIVVDGVDHCQDVGNTPTSVVGSQSKVPCSEGSDCEMCNPESH